MDAHRFDQLTRVLGGATTRRSALGALAGLLAGGRLTAEAKGGQRRKKCDPACPAGQSCVKGACTCDNGGAVCGAICCRTGQRCEEGACVAPPRQCIPAGESCKGVGRRCCDGRACASGQGGEADVACYVPAGGACATTSDCVWFAACEGGVCVDRQPQPTPACVATGQRGCAAPADCCDARARCDDGLCTTTCTVCASGCAYRTIEAAIADPDAGDDITVAAGTYTPPATYYNGDLYLAITRSLTLRACAPGTTVTIECPGEYACIDVFDAEVRLEDLALEGSTTNFNGVEAYGTSSLTLKNVSIDHFFEGIWNGGTSTTTILEGVTVANAQYGLDLSGGSFACNHPVTFTSVVSNCNNLADPACGC